MVLHHVLLWAPGTSSYHRTCCACVKVAVVGAGGVGAAFASVARQRGFFERITLGRPRRGAVPEAAVVAGLDDGRFAAARVDASDEAALVAFLRETKADAVLNATDPRFNPQVFAAAFETRCTYLDMAMTLSEPHPERPYEEPGVLLGERQFAEEARWRGAGLLALVGMGVEPGLADVFARYAADELFSEIDEVGVRDGANLVVGRATTSRRPSSIWTTIARSPLNPPLLWERGRGFFTTEPFSEPELFDFPEGIGRVECVNVEHEEVVLIPRAIDCRRVTFKYGLGEEFISVLRTLHKLGLDSAGAGVELRGVEDRASRRDRRVRCPNPAQLGDRMSGKTCAGTLVTGIGKNGAAEGAVYLYHVARPRGVDAKIRTPGGRPADGAQPRRRAGAARDERGPGPVSSGRKPTGRRSPSSRSSPSTATRTRRSRGDPRFGRVVAWRARGSSSSTAPSSTRSSRSSFAAARVAPSLVRFPCLLR